jgi:hypothetical protein
MESFCSTFHAHVRETKGTINSGVSLGSVSELYCGFDVAAKNLASQKSVAVKVTNTHSKEPKSDLLIDGEKEEDAETLSGTDLDFEVPPRSSHVRDTERIFDGIVEEKKPHSRSRKRKSNEKVPQRTRSRRARRKEVSDPEEESAHDEIGLNISVDAPAIVSGQADMRDELETQSTASIEVSIPHPSLPSIRDVSTEGKRPIGATDGLGMDIGQISPISAVSQDLNLSPVILCVASEQSEPLLRESSISPTPMEKQAPRIDSRLPKVRDQANNSSNKYLETSRVQMSKQESSLPPRPVINNIFTVSPKVKKRVGKLGLAKGTKVANKLSFELVKTSSQSSIDFQDTSSPVSEPKSSPMKPAVEDLGKREIVMPVRNARTITYGRSQIDNENPLGNVSVPSASTEPEEEIESDREDHGIDEGLESSDDEGKPRVRGIHELREAGHSKRTRDELEYISEGLSSNKLNIQRSTAVDILKKLVHAPFVTNIRIHGYLSKIFQVCRSHPDTILNVTLCYIICYLGTDLKNLEGLVLGEVVQWLFESMDKYLKENIMLQLPKKRYEKGLVLELMDHVQKLSWESDPIHIDNLLECLLCSLVEEKDVRSTMWLPTSTVLGQIASAIESGKCTKDCEKSILILECLTHKALDPVEVYHQVNILPSLWTLLSKTISIRY